MLVLILSALFTQCTAALQSVLVGGAEQDLAPPKFPDFAFSEKWLVLGPFQVGTRGSFDFPLPLLSDFPADFAP